MVQGRVQGKGHDVLPAQGEEGDACWVAPCCSVCALCSVTPKAARVLSEVQRCGSSARIVLTRNRRTALDTEASSMQCNMEPTHPVSLSGFHEMDVHVHPSPAGTRCRETGPTSGTGLQKGPWHCSEGPTLCLDPRIPSARRGCPELWLGAALYSFSVQGSAFAVNRVSNAWLPAATASHLPVTRLPLQRLANSWPKV